MLDGNVIGPNIRRHRRQEFIRFLNTVEAQAPASKLIHTIVAHQMTIETRCLPLRRRETNANPKPFVWTLDPERLLAAVKRGKQALKSVH